MAAFLTKHGYSGRRTAAELLARLRAAPAGTGRESSPRRSATPCSPLVGVLAALNAAVKSLDRSVAAHLGEHPDGAIFTSLPRSGQVNAAQVLAEWGDCRQAYDGPDSVAALAGVHARHQPIRQAPRRALPLGLQQALPRRDDHLRRQQPARQPLGRQDLRDARASGKDHPHAIRVLARAWIRVIWPCWLNGTPYDPARHGAAAALAETSCTANRRMRLTQGVSYRIVVRGSACDAASCASRNGTPASRAAVMKACLSVWGVTDLPILARRAVLRTIRPAPWRSSRRPSAARNAGPPARSPMARSIARAVRGASGMVTTLPPLRVIVSVRCPRSRPRCSMSAPVASQTRRPLSASSEIRACSAGAGRARRRPAGRRARCGPARSRGTRSPPAAAGRARLASDPGAPPQLRTCRTRR